MKRTFKAVFTSSLMLTIAILILSNPMQAQESSPPESQGQNVLDVVNSMEETSEFAGLLQQSGYGKILKQKGPYTILAPSNEAIQNADSKLKKNPKQLMKGQLFQGNVPKDQIESQMGVTVQKSDKSASNGTVYVVDKVVSQ